MSDAQHPADTVPGLGPDTGPGARVPEGQLRNLGHAPPRVGEDRGLRQGELLPAECPEGLAAVVGSSGVVRNWRLEETNGWLGTVATHLHILVSFQGT